MSVCSSGYWILELVLLRKVSIQGIEKQLSDKELSLQTAQGLLRNNPQHIYTLQSINKPDTY